MDEPLVKEMSELLQLREQLLSQTLQCDARIKALQAPEPEPSEVDNVEILKEDLFNETGKKFQHQQQTDMLQAGMKRLEITREASATEHPEVNRLLLAKLEQEKAQNIDLKKLIDENAKLEQQDMELAESIRELMHENRRLTAELLAAKEGSHKTKKKLPTRAENEIQQKREQITLIQHTFQSLVAASKVNWAKDPHLRKIVIDLGRPIDDLLKDHT